MQTAANGPGRVHEILDDAGAPHVQPLPLAVGLSTDEYDNVAVIVPTASVARAFDTVATTEIG